MSPQQKLEISIVVPLEDPRGDIADNLKTWMREQGLPRERYQLVVAGNGEHPDFERDVAAILAPHDVFAPVPGGTMIGLYAAAANAARAPILLFTEAHVRAEPDCLARAIDAFSADPKLAAGVLNFVQSSQKPVDAVVGRWLDDVIDGWNSAGWVRFNATANVIRASALARAGGIDTRFRLYAFPYLSARLHDQGERVIRLEDARAIHLVDDAMGETFWASDDWTRGECVLRAEEPEFYERYFGSGGLWERRLAYRPEIARSMLAALRSAIRHHPRDAGWLSRELVARLPARVGGAAPRRTWERATAALHKAAASTGVFPERVRRRSFLSANDRTAAAAQLAQGAEMNGLPAPAPAGTIGAEHLDGVLIGAHGLERDGARRFRWTEPVSVLRVDPGGGESRLRVMTGGLRGSPLDYLQGIYVGGEQLPGDLVNGDFETLEVRLPARLAHAVADSGVVLICRPLIPSRNGSTDSRRLGMPIAEIELTPG
jgi:hypothetical protein